jgi:hypothetical protein
MSQVPDVLEVNGYIFTPLIVQVGLSNAKDRLLKMFGLMMPKGARVPRPHPGLLPREKKKHLPCRVIRDGQDCRAMDSQIRKLKAVKIRPAGMLKVALQILPLPPGEGRGEGGSPLTQCAAT